MVNTISFKAQFGRNTHETIQAGNSVAGACATVLLARILRTAVPVAQAHSGRAVLLKHPRQTTDRMDEKAV
jgi:hypothetical protein